MNVIRSGTAFALYGQWGKLAVQLAGIGHTFPDDVDVLLVGPTGENVVVMSDTGGGADIAGVDVTFADRAAASLPDGTLTSGTFRPTNIGSGDAWPAPAPAVSGSAALAAFDGSDPNGAWSLFVVDDADDDDGVIAGGWCRQGRRTEEGAAYSNPEDTYG